MKTPKQWQEEFHQAMATTGLKPEIFVQRYIRDIQLEALEHALDCLQEDRPYPKNSEGFTPYARIQTRMDKLQTTPIV